MELKLGIFAMALAGVCSAAQMVSGGSDPMVSLVDSPGWFQVDNSANWFSNLAPPQGYNDEATGFTGVFQFDQFFTTPAGYYTIDEVNTDDLQQVPIDHVAFGNGAAGGVLEFYAPFYMSYPPFPDPLAAADPQANNLGAICTGTVNSPILAHCPQTFHLETTAGATVGVTVFDDFGADPSVSFAGAVATPEPGLLWPVSMMAGLMAITTVRSRRRKAVV